MGPKADNVADQEATLTLAAALQDKSEALAICLRVGLMLCARVRELEAMIEGVRAEARAAIADRTPGGQHVTPSNSIPISAAHMLLRITGGR